MRVMRRPNTAESAPEGARDEQIWATPESAAGILTMAAGQRLVFAGERLHHHIWVLDGEADLLGSTLTSGAYVHVEPGAQHALDASSTLGCTVFHVFEEDGVRVSAVVQPFGRQPSFNEVPSMSRTATRDCRPRRPGPAAGR